MLKTNVKCLLAITAFFFMGSLQGVGESTTAEHGAQCDAQCTRKAAAYVAAEFASAAKDTQDVNLQDCYAAWAKFDEQVASGSKAGVSPGSSEQCANALSRIVGQNGPGTNTEFAAGNTPPDAGESGVTAAQAALAAQTGNATSEASALVSLVKDLFGQANADQRSAYNAEEYQKIDESANQLFGRLEPVVTYGRLMALQQGLDLSSAEQAPSTAASQRSATKSLNSLLQRANAGDGAAQLALGLQYLHGDGVQKDVVLAYKWAKLAADNRVANAPEVSRNIYAELSGQQRSQAKVLINAFYSEHKGN